jgi:hypothetical protein
MNQKYILPYQCHCERSLRSNLPLLESRSVSKNRGLCERSLRSNLLPFNSRILIIMSMVFLVLLLPLSIAQAQDEYPLKLSFSRDFGYSSGGGQIQGTFSMRIKGPENLRRVVFLIDEEVIGEATTAPFRLQFNTDSYPLGIHKLSAKGYTADGQELLSNTFTLEFVEASEGWATAGKIVLPVLGVIALVALISFLIPTVFRRGKKTSLAPGAPRNYGVLGGAICPKCGRPFGMHFWGLNMVVGKLDRCPYCGKWSLVRFASREALRAAEEAELEAAKEIPPLPATGEDESLKKEIENSRYIDS